MVKVVHTSDIFAPKDSHSYKSVFQTKERLDNYGKSTYDSYEKSLDLEQSDCCETYHDWSKINVGGYVPVKSRLYSSIHLDIQIFMRNYHLGNYTEEEVKDYMKKCCEIKIDYATWSTPEKKISEEEKEAIICQTYAIFEERNVRGAVQACSQEGKEICESKGYYDGDYRNFAYYDAEKYYSWKEMKNSLSQFVDEIGKELLGVEKEYHLYKDPIHRDVGFQREWNGCFVIQEHFKYAVSETEEPPRGFKFFYRFDQEGYVEFQEKKEMEDVKEKKIQKKFQWNNLLNMLGAEHLDFLKRFFREVDYRDSIVRSLISDSKL